MTSPRRATERPLTVVVCTACATDRDLSMVDELRPTIQRCAHAILVAAPCMLGPLTCASRPSGVMAAVQPCTKDRMACGPTHWIGPVTDSDDSAALRDWLELGQWENTPMPTQLSWHQRTRRN